MYSFSKLRRFGVNLDQLCFIMLNNYDIFCKYSYFDQWCVNINRYVPGLWKLYEKHKKYKEYLVAYTDKFKDTILLDVAFSFEDDIINFELFFHIRMWLMTELYIEPELVGIITRLVYHREK